MANTSYQCSYCKEAYFTIEELKAHEEKCPKSGKSGKDRFDAIIQQRNKGKHE